MIRVLAICNEDPKWILGGMGMHVRELYRTMAERDDMQVDLLTQSPEDDGLYLGVNKFVADRLVCYKPPHPGMSGLLITDIQMLKTVLRLYAEGRRWDVIHAHEWGAQQVARAVRDSLDLPLVSTMHLCITKLAQLEALDDQEAAPQPPPEDNVYLMTQEGKLIGESDELIMCSRAYGRLAREVFLSDREVNVIYNGVRCDEWHPGAGNAARARSKHGLNGRPIALFVGRIATMKGIVEVLDAVEAEDTGHTVVLAGEVNANNEEQKEGWDVTQRIRRLEKELPERFRWVGFQHGQDLKDLYAAAQVGLMPSTHEPFGIVALEAMAMGLPLITTDVDGLGEIVTDSEGGEYALIIQPKSGQQIVEGLKLLGGSEELRMELSELGRKRAHDFDWHVAVDQTVGVYRRVIDRRS